MSSAAQKPSNSWLPCPGAWAGCMRSRRSQENGSHRSTLSLITASSPSSAYKAVLCSSHSLNYCFSKHMYCYRKMPVATAPFLLQGQIVCSLVFCKRNAIQLCKTSNIQIHRAFSHTLNIYESFARHS